MIRPMLIASCIWSMLPKYQTSSEPLPMISHIRGKNVPAVCSA